MLRVQGTGVGRVSQTDVRADADDARPVGRVSQKDFRADADDARPVLR